MVNEHIRLQKENAIAVIGIGRVWEMMKFIPGLCMCLALFIGCGEPNLDDPKVREKILAKAIGDGDLRTRWTSSGEEMRYTPNQQVGHTGWVKGTRELWQLKHGKKHGIYISWWYSNQQNMVKGTYKDGSKNGLWTEWHENGQKSSEGIYKDGSEDGSWTYWSENGQKYSGLPGHSGDVNSVAFSPDGRTLASGSGGWSDDDNTIRLWDAVTGAHQRTLTGHTNWVRSVAFSPDGRTLASGSWPEIRLWDAVTGAHQLTLTGHTRSVESVAFSPDGRTLASGSKDNTIRLWELTPSSNATQR